jgi:hypothetical protein
MYIVRRVSKVQKGQEWKAAALLTRIAAAYEAKGRNKAQIYMLNPGVPGEGGKVFVEWTTERIEPNYFSKIPKEVLELNKQLREIQEDTWIEFYEAATPEKLTERGLL